MTNPVAGRAGVYVVRAWIEDGGFRARVSWSDDVLETEEEAVTADPDEVRRLLDRWLDRVLAARDSR